MANIDRKDQSRVHKLLLFDLGGWSASSKHALIIVA